MESEEDAVSTANAYGLLRGAFALLCLLIAWSSAVTADDGARTPVVLVAPLQAGVERTPDLVGEVVPETDSVVGFQAGGRIAERLVRRGQRVEAGEVLARLDERDLRARVDSARSALSQARAEATLAGQELARIRDLFKRDVATRQQLDQAVSRQRATTAAVDSAQARLVEARNALDYAELRAPFGGVLTALLADAGDVVAVGQPVLRLAGDDRLVEVAVPESRLSGLPETAEVDLQADGESVPASLDTISGAADPASRTFAVRYRLDETQRDRPWAIGQTARLAFSPGQPVRRVPVGAVFARDDQPQVFRLVDGRVEVVDVRVRAIEADHAVIETDLPEGTLIVAAGVNRLHDGQAVRARQPRDMAAGAANGDRR